MSGKAKLLQNMDHGHYNCRDYYITPHFSATTITIDRNPLYRHESFDELEQRSRSPASKAPKFPFLRLPLELRQQIYSYLLPYTNEGGSDGKLVRHAHSLAAVQKNVAAKERIQNVSPCSIPQNAHSSHIKPTLMTSTCNVVWRRGNIKLLCVCKQMHDECAELLYGTSTWLLFVSFGGIHFRFRWLLNSGMAPSANKQFLELLSLRYLRLIKKVVVYVDAVDSYTGMIKYNHGGKGLTHGLKKQVQRLVTALRAVDTTTGEETRLTKINIRIGLNSLGPDPMRPHAGRRDCGAPDTHDLEEVLQPFGQLRGVGEVSIDGIVTEDVAGELTKLMSST